MGWVFRTEEDPMANVELRYASGPSARYLDVSPMISALRFQPDDFEFKHGWLHHVPSRHRFQFDRMGRVTIDALCGCASLSVKPEQTDELVVDVQDLAQRILDAARDEPRVRLALPQAQRLGAAVPRHADGVPAVPAPRRTGRHSGRRPGAPRGRRRRNRTRTSSALLRPCCSPPHRGRRGLFLSFRRC